MFRKAPRKVRIVRLVVAAASIAGVLAASPAARAQSSEGAAALLERIGGSRGICVLIGSGQGSRALELARASELTVYVQSRDARDVAAARTAADAAGLLGRRIYIERGSAERVNLADNLADAVVVADVETARPNQFSQTELLRVLRPGGKLLLGARETVKPFPAGVDDWTHPYHGPDNNPQSRDTVARAPYLTQFLAKPWYGPMPEVTVVSAGRMFKAFGHISFKKREWPLVNTLLALNAYNGTTLWERKLKKGFMIHRSTIVATPETLYLADDTSCKLIDPVTGRVRDEIVPPEELNAGTVWKWMAIQDGILYALVGGEESPAGALRGTRTQAGWPWSGLGRGYARRDYPWGFGRTIFAMDPAAKKLLWSHREEERLDSRGMAMNSSRLFFYSHENFLGSLDLKTGGLVWKTSDPGVLEAVGGHDRAQTASKGYSSTAYIKCSEEALYFAGPQRPRLVAVSAENGKLLWQYADDGNFQLVLRDDALYAMGRLTSSKKFDLLTGKVLAELACFRGNCTRATGTVDSIFSRGHRHSGTLRLQLADDQPQRIALMRPACQDGVIVAGGLLYWGPWMCDCNLSLVGVISLGPAGSFDFSPKASEAARLERGAGDPVEVMPRAATRSDWPTYRADNARSASTAVRLGERIKRLWHYEPPAPVEPTAPVAAAGLFYWSGSDGTVRAVDAATGRQRWTAYTGGQVHFSPSYWRGRLFVGSADGWVYALEAATGRRLWRFRAAPVERKIPVYGKLASTWPVASGVLVDDGTAYAAAGIASYDGTHVYALDAVTGKLRWQNSTSGRLIDEKLVSGVSVQGHLLLHRDRLYLAGGNVVSPARYDIRTGECQNELRSEWLRNPRQQLVANARSMDMVKAPRGRELFLVGDEVRAFDQLLYAPKKYQVGRYFAGHFLQASSGDVLLRGTGDRIVRMTSESISKGKPRVIWESRAWRETAGLVLTGNAVLVAGKQRGAANGDDGSHSVTALDLENGRELWSLPLPGAPAPWGMAVDRAGRIVVALETGSVVCFGSP